MSKADRWLFTVALNLCVIPIVTLGIVFQLLPEQIPIINLITQVTNTTSKYNDLVICLFVLVPLAMIVLAAVLRYKRLIDRNYKFIAVASILLSAVFSAVLVYCLKVQTHGIELIRGIDYSTLVCCVLSIALSCIGTLLYGLKPNDAVGFRNRYTAKCDKVWVGTHNVLSYIANALFSVLAVAVSFCRGWYVVAVVLFVLALFIFGVVYLVSYWYYKRYAKTTTAL